MKLIRKISLFCSIFFIFSTIHPTFLLSQTNLKILITEVMPTDSSSDWIEFLVTAGIGSLKNFKVYAGNTVVKTFGDVTVKTGDYFVLNFNKNLSDETSKNPQNFFDFFTTNSGLTATDNIIRIIDDAGNILDALCFSNNDGTFTTANQTLLNNLQTALEWSGQNKLETECFIWSQPSGKSIARKFLQPDLPLETNSDSDWETVSPTKGFSNFIPPKPQSNLNILINEIMPENSDNDWLEFYVMSGAGSLKNFTIFEGNTLVKTLEDVMVSEGDYFVLNFDKFGTDETTKGTKNYFEFFTQDSGITATDNVIRIFDEAGKLLDALCYANNDGTFASTNKTLLENLQSFGAWDGTNSTEDECVIWTPTHASSISRKYSQNQRPIDSNSKNDWEIAKPTKGKAKLVVLDDFNQDVGLEILNKHFSPFGDYKYNTIGIKYKNRNNSTLIIKIYDINQHIVKKLLETAEESVSLIEWDGKNESGSILPVGIYIIYFEFSDRNSGILKKGKKAVVLGKAL